MMISIELLMVWRGFILHYVSVTKGIKCAARRAGILEAVPSLSAFLSSFLYNNIPPQPSWTVNNETGEIVVTVPQGVNDLKINKVRGREELFLPSTYFPFAYRDHLFFWGGCIGGELFT